MVVETMNFNEVRKEIFKDYAGIIKNKMLIGAKKLRKVVLSVQGDRKVKLPWQHFKSTETGINYGLIQYSINKKDLKKNGSLYILYAYVKLKDGVYAFMLSGDNCSLCVYTPHFIKRYKERFLKDDTMILTEVLDEFFEHNSCSVHHIEDSQKYENSFFANTTDGVLLGVFEEKNIQYVYRHIDTFIYKTFISKDMLKNNQIDKDVFMKDFRKEYLSMEYQTDKMFEG